MAQVLCQTLSPGAPEKVTLGTKGVVVQIAEIREQPQKIAEREFMYKGEVSDGYCRMKAYFDPKPFREKPMKYQNAIIRLDVYAGDPKMLIIQEFTLLHHYPSRVGSPVSYKQFLVNKNPNSTNIIDISLLDIKPTTSNQNIKDNISSTSTEPKSTSAIKAGASANNAQPETMTPSRRKNQAVKVSDVNNLCDITDLYPGLQGDWRIMCRVIKSNYRQFMSKKGSLTKLLELVLLDRKNSKIKANIFGNHASVMEKEVEVGQIYMFGNGSVKLDTYRSPNSEPNMSEYTLMFGEQSVFTLVCDDNSIKKQTIGYLTVKDLRNKVAFDEVDVVAILKDLRPATDVKTKDSRTIRKRVGVICDPENKVELDVTFWNDMVDLDASLLQKTILLSEFKVQEYNGGLSINSNFKSKIMPLPGHAYSKFEHKLQSIPFQNISFRRDNTAETTSNIKQLEIAMESLKDQGSVWSELRVYLNKIREKGKRDYIGCPSCKKTCTEGSTECGSCGKTFPRPQARYLLGVQLSDCTGAFWTTAYDDFAERIFKIVGDYPADQVRNYTQEQFKALANKCLYQEFRLKVVTRFQLLEGSRRPRHNVVSIMPLDFVAEARKNLDYIRRKMS